MLWIKVIDRVRIKERLNCFFKADPWWSLFLHEDGTAQPVTC